MKRFKHLLLWVIVMYTLIISIILVGINLSYILSSNSYWPTLLIFNISMLSYHALLLFSFKKGFKHIKEWYKHK